MSPKNVKFTSGFLCCSFTDFCYLFALVYGQDILISDKSFSVNNGDRLVLNCADRDLSLLQGTVNVTWFKDGVTIPDEDPRVNAVADDTLLLAQVQQKDAGTYICTAEATGFQSTSTTRLFVIGQ